jgi:uncharacterized protein YndB with AHSA1/START domain
MRNGRGGVGAVTLACAIFAFGTAGADSAQIPMVRIHSDIQIAAPPAAVWAFVTSGKNFATWCPNWRAPANAKLIITRVGDVLDYTDAFGNGGRSIVTYLVRDRELRITHEPNKGDYICQAKIVLAQASGGTLVDFWDQYTDESAAKDMEATRQKMQAAADQSLADIKRAIEKK